MMEKDKVYTQDLLTPRGLTLILLDAKIIHDEISVVSFDHHRIGMGLGFSGALFRISNINCNKEVRVPSFVLKHANMINVNFRC